MSYEKQPMSKAIITFLMSDIMQCYYCAIGTGLIIGYTIIQKLG